MNSPIISNLMKNNWIDSSLHIFLKLNTLNKLINSISREIFKVLNTFWYCFKAIKMEMFLIWLYLRYLECFKCVFELGGFSGSRIRNIDLFLNSNKGNWFYEREKGFVIEWQWDWSDESRTFCDYWHNLGDLFSRRFRRF